MSAYEYLTIETLPEHAILQQIMQLEARMFTANTRIRAAIAEGDRDALTEACQEHRAYGEQIDALISEQDRRATLPAEIRAGEHPPPLFEDLGFSPA